MKTKTIRRIELIFLLLFAVGSFGPCLIGEYQAGSHSTAFYANYNPRNCLCFLAAELFILKISKRIWSQVVRLLLNLIKILAPFFSFEFLNEFFQNGGVGYRFGILGYAMIGIWFFTGLCIVLEMICTIKERYEGQGDTSGKFNHNSGI